MKWLIVFLLLLFGFLQYHLWFSESGMLEIWRLKHAVSAQQADNVRLRDQNRALLAEVQDLKRGQAAIEERARNELGMVKKGETFYQVVK